MDTNPFRTVRAYLGFAPAAKWAAVAASLIASAGLILAFPVLYLFTDLLVWQGYVPGYDGLTPTRQAAFRAEWENTLSQNPDVTDLVKKVRPPVEKLPEAVEWEFRWRAATYHTLATAVAPDAAEAYLPLTQATAAGPPAPPRQPLGILSPVARARTQWFGKPLAAAARVAPWAWHPDGHRAPTVPYLTGLFVAAIVLAAGRGLLVNIASHSAGIAAREGVTRLRRTVFTHSYRLQPVAIKADAQEEAGELVSTRCEHVHDGFVAWLTGSVRGPVQAALLVAILVVVHPGLGAALLLFAALVWLATSQAVGWLRHDARVAARRTESRLGLLRESVYLCQLVKGYLMDRYSQTRVERHLAELGRAAWRKQRGEAAVRSGQTTVAALAGLAMLYLAARTVFAGDLTLPGLLVLAAALAALVTVAGGWAHARSRVHRARGAAAVLVEFLDRRGEPGQPMEAEFLQPLTRRLDLIQVSLREAGTGRMLLEDVSLNITAGSRSAVVFADVTEAHTLAFLLVRFLDPTAGEIKIDGKNLRWVTAESLRTQ
ncbi:MAG: ABC transporter transmembrane domain-containing protein, partial [Fimbriiglobus sp.]